MEMSAGTADGLVNYKGFYMARWDKKTELLIVGTGAGGMTAAIEAHDRGLRPLLIEKSNTFGGTSATSGGSIWIPMNSLMQEIHLQDSMDDAWQYLIECIGAEFNEKKVKAYLQRAPEIIDRLRKQSAWAVKVVPEFCDYYPLRPGGSKGGRTLEALPYFAKNLGEHLTRLHPAYPQELLFNSIALSSQEGLQLLKGGKPAMLLFLKTLFQWLIHLGGRQGHPFRLCLGNAFASRLFHSIIDRQIPVWYETKLFDIIVENNRVVGAVLEKDQQKIRIQTERGIILAAGGFAKNQAMREQYLPQPTQAAWSAAQSHDQGDVIQIGQRIGAAVALMDEAWWMPATVMPDEPLPWIMVFEKALPGSMIVNQAGKRFTNEAAPYLDVVKSIYACQASGTSAVPCYLIMDAHCRKRYPLGNLLPGQIQPDFLIKKSYKEKWLTRGKTIVDLAKQLNLNATHLAQTIEEFNQHARLGKDPLFHRGESPYDNCYITENTTGVCLAPLTKGPFYAIPIFPGDIGTKGGLVTDEWARVLNTEGSLIENLYATGNCSASIMGRTYPGAGSTLGPAMIFGAIAAEHAAN